MQSFASLLAACSLGIATLAWPRAASASSALDLVRMARAYEQSHDDDIALRRYSEALFLDPTCEEAYLGLGSLRARRGDLRESDRVYSVALEHVPTSRAARTARAYVRHALGEMPAAIDDLLGGAEDETAALRVVASWYAGEGQAPAQLSVWRRIAARAEGTGQAALLHEANLMIRALVIVVGSADPVAAPPDARGWRATVSTLARRAR